MRADAIRDHKIAIEGILKGWRKSVNFLESNRVEAVEIMSRAFGLTEEKVEQLLPTIIYEGKDRNLEMFGTKNQPGPLYNLYDRISEAWLSEGVINQRDSAEDGIDPTFVRRVLN